MKVRVAVNRGMTAADRGDGEAERCRDLHLLPAAGLLPPWFLQ